MAEATLSELAQRAGVSETWVDETGVTRTVDPGVLQAVLAAIGYPCRTAAEIAESMQRASSTADRLPSLITASVGLAEVMPAWLPTGSAQLELESGSRVDITITAMPDGRSRLPRIAEPGYHRLRLGSAETTVAVAPLAAHGLDPGARLWGIAAQLYALRREGDLGIGDLGAAADLARAAAAGGADALALSPMHAMFAALPEQSSPYSPSNRLFLNPLLADPGEAPPHPESDNGSLIDWPNAARRKLAFFRSLFDRWTPDADFEAFRRAGGEDLERHAAFEVLHGRRIAADPADGDWRRWPAELRDPESATASALAGSGDRDVLFHIFLQWLASRSLAKAQAAARDAGMRIGLIADLAVGIDPRGSGAWSAQRDMLSGLSIGSPPDPFNPDGQSWGLTTFSPTALAARGFEPFLKTVRAALRLVGGVRIDHIMGLQRLWVVPDGAPRGSGAYLAYPLKDLLRLVALESHRHRAIVIGEDLGTVPSGFRQKLKRHGLMGMSVLWFERRRGASFAAPSTWRPETVAMTSTHDLPTVAGWWSGADLKVRAGAFERDRIGMAELSERRQVDRVTLWRAFRRAGITDRPPPPPEVTEPAVEAALRFIGRTPCPLALVPIEDLLGLVDQPNLPGTTTEHPNWRRRLDRPGADLLDGAATRIKALKEARGPR